MRTVRPIELHPPVSIVEAEQFRRLYTVATYVAGGIPSSIQALKTYTGSLLINKPALTSSDEWKLVDPILDEITGGHNTEQELMGRAREQFDLGTESAETVNAEFKDRFREFVGLCADELMAFDPDPDEMEKNPFITPDRVEEIHNFFKRVKRSLIRLVESMSRSGRTGDEELLRKWGGIIQHSVRVLEKVGQDHIDPADSDQKHEWSVVAALNGRSREEINGYLVHAKEGGFMLADVIEIYRRIDRKRHLAKEETDFLRKLFHDKAYLTFMDRDDPAKPLTVSERLRLDATLIQENWIPEWSA